MVNKPVDILVIDDNDLQLEYLSHLLNAHGYIVHTTDDSKNAFTTIKNIHPRLIILDIMMPEVDGFTILKKIRDDEKLKSIPVIVYTSKMFAVDKKKALFLGANSFITKPVKGAVIIDEIKKFL
jgi:PleD family two-component response regulator